MLKVFRLKNKPGGGLRSRNNDGSCGQYDDLVLRAAASGVMGCIALEKE